MARRSIELDFRANAVSVPDAGVATVLPAGDGKFLVTVPTARVFRFISVRDQAGMRLIGATLGSVDDDAGTFEVLGPGTPVLLAVDVEVEE